MIAAEVNLLERNETIFVKEYFDGIGNRARIETTANGSLSVTIADYNGREAFVFPLEHVDVIIVAVSLSNFF